MLAEKDVFISRGGGLPRPSDLHMWHQGGSWKNREDLELEITLIWERSTHLFGSRAVYQCFPAKVCMEYTITK